MSDTASSLVITVLAIAFIVPLVGFGSGFSGTVTAEEVGGCRTIDSAGTYHLNSSVTTDTNDVCFLITASDVVLDGANRTVTVTGSGEAVNVSSAGSITNVTVQNLQIELSGAGTGAAVHAPADHATVDVSIRNNVINDTTDVGIAAATPGRNSTVSLDIHGNTVATDGYSIGIIQVDGPGSNVSLSLTDNTIRSSDRGIHTFDANDANQTVNITLAGNDILAGDEGIYLFALYGDHSDHTITIVNNTIDSDGSAGLAYIEAGGGEYQTLDINISENTITGQTAAIGQLNPGGTDTTAVVRLLANTLTAQGAEASGIDLSVGRDAQSADIAISTNTITAASDGIVLESSSALGAPSGGLVLESNSIHAGGSAIRLDNGPDTAIEVHDNLLSGDDYGIENQNATNGTYLNATNNDWNASDGPASAGSYADPVTGALANGSGSNVTAGNATHANVRFDPFVGSGSESGGSQGISVAIDSTNSPVTEGETLSVESTVENTHSQPATQTVTLSVGDVQRDSQTVTLAGGESTTLVHRWETQTGDAGEYTATVATENDSAERAVTVQREQQTVDASVDPAFFSVSIEGTNAPINESEQLNLSAKIWNTGDETDTQTVTLATNGTTRDSRTLRLGGGASQTITLTWATADGDAGTYTARVASDDETARRNVTLTEAPTASITFTNQTVSTEVTTQAITIASVNLSDGGYVVVYNVSNQSDAQGERALGVSSYLESGHHENVRIALSHTVNRTQLLLAVPHLDTDDDQRYEYTAESDADVDVPYSHRGVSNNGSAWIDPVQNTPVPTQPITPTPTPTPSPSPMPTSTLTATPTRTPTPDLGTETQSETQTTAAITETDSPGFGPLIAVISLILWILGLSGRRT